MPTSRTGSSTGGFTTIELLVVLVIMVIISTVVAVSLAPTYQEARIRSACRTIVAALTYARSYAVTAQAEARVVFTDDGQGVAVQLREEQREGEPEFLPLTTPAGRFHRLPDKVSVENVRKTTEVKDDSSIVFTQLGQTENAIITVVDTRDNRRLITLDAVTGRCDVTLEDELAR